MKTKITALNFEIQNFDCTSQIEEENELAGLPDFRDPEIISKTAEKLIRQNPNFELKFI